MATQKFTAFSVKNLKPSEREFTVREAGGLALRVRPSGAKTWLYIYDFLGRRRKMSLGVYPNMDLRIAREACFEAKKQLGQGVDPSYHRRQKQEEHKVQVALELSEPSVKQLVNEYLDRYAKVKKKTWKEDERILFKDVVPSWGNLKAKDVSRRDINLLLDRVTARGGVMANRTLAVIRRMFNFAIERGLLEQSPASYIKASAKERRRERFLTYDEIRTFWLNLDQAPASQLIKIALKLILVTGQRPGEIIGAQWVDIDLAAQWWTIPKERTKNGHTHRVPLNTTALTLLDELRRISLSETWLFPSPRLDHSQPMKPTALCRALNRSNFDGIAHFTPHDLRRTMATVLGELKFNRLIQDKILNHVDQTVGGIYDRHSYDGEKRQAMTAWDHRLAQILTGEVSPSFQQEQSH